ncbi:HIT family protein [Pseudoalteromonas tunicata]|jgi:histidine triad (HIT) family protein|uniref:HIT domain-containing protein n=1 Tax=Pseudoalteromonas tunicata D2 TaxID=87626 RepID=A4C3V1_9GAMM|nr:HIT domain-containing protein [Pseudoalteromonas tunicata]ATC96488.1 hypothetical protein PTUN_b0011 [Pseudoalteromonas tunicata]AXT33362.1 HIT domain-containing protein [Pseudoalteromonas tunicata]EAR30233.1 hypothetical protein PTD2_01651 [Pseudoalteromonas tunicata D2]
MDYQGNDFYCEQVLSGKVKPRMVKEDKACLAFYHTKPFWPVHIVVIPKLHVPSLTQLGSYSASDLQHLICFVAEVAAMVENQYGAARVLTNLGQYQDSKHLHFHINFGSPDEV